MPTGSTVICSLLLVVALPPFPALVAQEPARNRAYLDLGGAGIVYSINYERSLTNVLALRLGASGWPQRGYQYLLGFGVVSAHMGRGAHSAILGVGGGVAWFADVDLLEEADVVAVYGVLTLGYQFEPKPRGIFFRLLYTPFFSTSAFTPLWGGGSVGVTF